LKNRKKVSLGVIFLVVCSFSSVAQDTHNFTQFYFNPALLNPSFTGSDGRVAMYAAYRKQWSGVEGAPTIANFSLQAALPSRLNIGFSASNDKNGLLSNSGLLFTGGYSIPLSDINSLRFGISVGAAWNKVDLLSMRFSTASDPVQASLLASNMQVLGNVGLSFHSPTFHAGISVPNIFDPAYLSTESFTISKVNPFGTIIAHASNRFYFAKDKNIFEPYLIYRYNQAGPSQIEAAAVLHLQNAVWFGGSYKQNFGISALAGFKLKGKTAVGYSYTMKNTGTNQLSAPSHEIQIGILLGTRLKKIHAYSFVDTEKEKKRAKTLKELQAEKKQRDLANKLAMEKKQKQIQASKVPVKVPPKKDPVVAKKDPVKTDPVVVKKDPVKEPVKTDPVIAQKDPVKEPVKTDPVVVSKDPVKTDPAKIDPTKTVDPAGGGPRMKQKADPLQFGSEEEKVQHEEEQEKIKRLGEHADDPDEHHGLEDTEHPHKERHEFVKRGTHVDEMEVGDYIIAGVFKSKENAKHFSDGLVSLGFSISDFGYQTERNLWYVYLGETDDLDMAKRERDKYRKMKMFKDCWLLTVQH
jgi:Bacteroidetes-specific putative membrane protein